MLIITLILIKRWVRERGSHILLHGSACSHCSLGCVSPHWPTFRSQRPLARHIWCPSIDHFCHWNLLSWLLRLDSLLAFSPPHKLLRSFHTASAPWSSHPACGWLYLTTRVPCFYRPPWGGTLVSSRSRHSFSWWVHHDVMTLALETVGIQHLNSQSFFSHLVLRHALSELVSLTYLQKPIP